MRYTVLGVVDGIAISFAFKFFNGMPNEIFLLAFFVAAFFGGMMADYGQGVWAGFFASLVFPVLWLPQLLQSPDMNGWLFIVGFFLVLGLISAFLGGLIGIIGNVVGRRVFHYERDL